MNADCEFLRLIVADEPTSLSAQVAEWYEEAATALRHKDLKQKLVTWSAIVDGQATLFSAWTQFHAAAEHSAEYEYGAQVCRLTHADVALTTLVKSSNRHGPPRLLLTQTEAHDTISKAAQRAAHLNENVYNERIPAFDSLAPMDAKPIVKPTKLGELFPSEGGLASASASSSHPTGGGTDSKGVETGAAAEAPAQHGVAHKNDPFSDLVPLAVLGDVSVFTAQRDAQLREMAERREDAGQLVSGELAEHDLPAALEAATTETHVHVPSPLSERLEHITSTLGGAAALLELIEDMDDRCAARTASHSAFSTRRHAFGARPSFAASPPDPRSRTSRPSGPPHTSARRVTLAAAHASPAHASPAQAPPPISPAPTDQYGAMRRARDAESLAQHIDSTLEVEEGADRQLQAVHGDRWRALPSAQLNADARAELSSLKAKLAAASQADKALREAYDSRSEVLGPLYVPFNVLQEQVRGTSRPRPHLPLLFTGSPALKSLAFTAEPHTLPGLLHRCRATRRGSRR